MSPLGKRIMQAKRLRAELHRTDAWDKHARGWGLTVHINMLVNSLRGFGDG